LNHRDKNNISSLHNYASSKRNIEKNLLTEIIVMVLRLRKPIDEVNVQKVSIIFMCVATMNIHRQQLLNNQINDFI
jgi:hypothetical protein